jgi:hypothetical protein
MKNQNTIEQQIASLEDIMLTTPATSPEWSGMVNRRRELHIELEQAMKPVQKQRATYVESYKFAR